MHTFAPQATLCQRTIRISGVVQGVGFRPAVWHHARALSLTGKVFNDTRGVVIVCEGEPTAIDQLVQRLQQTPPPGAQVSCLSQHPSDEPLAPGLFEITDSLQASSGSTGISPDLATCEHCLTELRDPNDSRYQYPFLNCTHCGPRLSIVKKLPYDRANTSMGAFELCSACGVEYEDPANRRFHAQPTACPACGPALWLCDRQGTAHTSDTPLDDAAEQLRDGAILAIKGLGGFHLVADATNAATVQSLRDRKCRPHKPFALMVRDIEIASRYCAINPEEAAALSGVAAPVVLLQRLANTPDLAGVAPNMRSLGLMLPHTPLHHLLLEHFETPLVMTSANRSGEPQCTDNDVTLSTLADYVDAFLLHNRDIVNRVDDSVAQVVSGTLRVMRRARGFAPSPLPLPPGFATAPAVLAMGGELKNTFCLLDDGRLVVSQHIGDLGDARTLDDFRSSLKLYLDTYRHTPACVAVDHHPNYAASSIGAELASSTQAKLVPVQHHHAHIASCLGENNRALDAPPVLGISLDGLGYAPDGGLWGGEFMLADYRQCRRVGGLAAAALPGGDLAAQQPWRNLLAQLHRSLGWSAARENYPGLNLLDTLQAQGADTLARAIDAGINAPQASSCGRLFDAVAAAAGYCSQGSISYEGQAAICLEAALQDGWMAAEPYSIAQLEHEDTLLLDPAPMWPELLRDLAVGACAATVSARFHCGLAKVLAEAAKTLAHRLGTDCIALSGGVWQNAALLSYFIRSLEGQALEVLTHSQIPANDGGLSLGQALVVAARHVPKQSRQESHRQSPQQSLQQSLQQSPQQRKGNHSCV